MPLSRAGSSKVYVTDAIPHPPAGTGPPAVLLTSASPRGPVAGEVPVRRSRSAGSSRRSLYRVLRQPFLVVRRRVLRPLRDRYELLFSWSTRQTIAVAIHLLAALYVFLSVPFRIAFLYSPFELHHRGWTPELTAFSALDVVADAVGAFEFWELFRLWRDSFSQLAASVDFELGKKMWREANKSMAAGKMMGAGKNAAALKPQWTLATIGARTAATSTGAGPSQANRGKGNSGHDSHEEHLRCQRLKKTLLVALEAVALVPLEVFPLASGNYNAMHLVRLSKLVRVYRIVPCVERFLRIYSERWWARRLSHTGISMLARIIGIGVLLCHLVACGYMLLAHVHCGIALEHCDPSVETSWIIRDQLAGAWTTRKYARALYWASRTIVMLGYSDVAPVSSGETLYVTVMQFVGALFSSSLLAFFLFIFRHRNAREAAFSAHVDNANEYMKSQNLPRELRRKVTAFFAYAWQTHHSLDSEEALHHLPKHLQSKIVATLKASRVRQVCFLMRESAEFINMLALSLRRSVYSPFDHIIEPKINAKMFFVIRGAVLLSAFDGSGAKECQTGDFFADSCLLSPEAYEEKAVAKTFCELYVLEKAHFDGALAHFYRGQATEARARMADVLDKYATQLRKTKQLLGLRGGGGGDSARGSAMGLSTHSIGGTGPGLSSPRGHNAIASGPSLAWHLPGSLFRMRWDLLRLLSTLFVAFEVPYFAAFISSRHAAHIFAVQQQLGARYVVTVLVEVLFGADMVLRGRFFSFVDPIVMLPVTDPGMIFAAYKYEGGFWLDLLACFPAGVVLESIDGATRSYSWWFRLARMLRLRRVPQLIHDLVEYHGMSSKFRMVVLLLLAVTFMLHVVGCIWFEMAWIFQPDGDVYHDSDTALTRSHCLEMATNFQNCSWVIFDCYGQVRTDFPVYNPTDTHYRGPFAYLRSVYWAVVALTGVGYGDIVAFSTAETYFAALWIFVGAIVNWCVIGAMSSTLTTLTANQHHHVEQINALNTIMEHLSISEELRREIRQFYNHHFHDRKKAYESQLLLHLPEQLCYEISSLLHADATKNVPLFDSAGREFLEEVTGKFRHRMYQNGETICLEGDICREFLVLLHGRVNMFAQGRKVPARALHDGDCYGISEFLAKRSHSTTLVAASAVEASVMTRELFDAVQRKFEEDYRDIRDEALQLWADEQRRLKRVLANLERMKLQTHVVHTPSLFYSRDQLEATNGDRQQQDSARRSPDAARIQFASAWNSLFTLINMYNAVFVIFRICFHSHLHLANSTYVGVAITDVACDLCFALDIYLRLYYFDVPDATAAWENLWQRKEVAAHYRHSRRFKRDVVAAIPLNVLINKLALAASLCRLPRLLRCTDLWVLLDDWIVQVQQRFASRNVSSYLNPVKLAIVFLLIAHYTGCIFFLISEWECESDPYCWISTDHIIHVYHESLSSLYVRSFYWALTTLTLVGTTEIVARRMAGTMWATLACLACTFLMGHVLDELSSLIMDVGKEKKEHKRRIDGFERFAKEHQLPEGLRSRVTAFLDIQFKQTEGRDLHEATHDLSANLKLKLMHEIYGASLLAMPISRLLTHSQINNLALRLHEELFVPGDSIVAEDTLGSRLCILRRGSSAVFWTQSSTPVAVLLEGCLFGEVAFFLPDQRRIATVKATTSCEVLYVSKNDWQELWAFNGDASDSQVQKYAQHSIFQWLMERLHGYQECSLRIASKAKRLMATRAANAPAPTSSTPVSANLHLLLPGAATSRPAVGGSAGGGAKAPWQHARSFPERRTSLSLTTSPATHLLEKKGRYLLAKSDTLTKKYRNMLVGASRRGRLSSRSTRGDRRRSESDIMSSRRPSLNFSVRQTTSRAAANAPQSESSTSYALFLQQFIVMVNPLNRHLRDLMDDQMVHELEDECWSRFKYLGTVSEAASDLAKALSQSMSTSISQKPGAPSDSTSAIANPTGQRPSILRRARSVAARRRGGPRITQMVKLGSFNVNNLTPDGALSLLKQQAKTLATNSALTGTNQGGLSTTARGDGGLSTMFDGRGGDRARRFSRLMDANVKRITANKKLAGELRMRRSQSLPVFSKAYFSGVKFEEDQRLRVRRSLVHGIQGALHETPGVNYDILQRAQRPKFASLFRLYRRYYQWRQGQRRGGPAVVAPRRRGSLSPRPVPSKAAIAGSLTSWTSQRNNLRLKEKKSVGGINHSRMSPRNALSKISAMSTLRWSSSMRLSALDPHKLMAETEDDARVHEFQRIMLRLGKLWDIMMLLVSLYHFIVTPFKVCFSSDLVNFPTGELAAWAGWEYFLDVLCLTDILYKIRRSVQASHALGLQQQMQQRMQPHKGHRHRLVALWARLSRSVAAYPAFWIDVAAIFPLELLALAIAPAEHKKFPDEWQLVWLLRLNRILFTLRFEPITDQLFQFIVYDLKLPVSEDTLVYARSLIKYIALGHFIACGWYIVSERSYEAYSYSWLSTSGMLVSTETSSGHSTSESTSSSSSASDFDLHHVPVMRKYLRSLDYALQSITTVFYGDIFSMNLSEMIAEMTINVWSIYIYGSLVGAHGRLLQEHLRKRATFEQNLFEMQHYLVQNEVPKKIKKQIKQYYARIWHRRQGENEFEAIAPLSRSLYRDVVFSTLRRFAWQVGIFHSMDVYFLRALLVALQYVVCSEGEEIVMIGDVDRSMYFIAQGRVLVKHERGEATREKGEFFGELALLHGISRQETCVALTVAELYRLDHEPYERVLIDFPDYRALNKLEWTTTAKTPPLASALQRFMRARREKSRPTWHDESTPNNDPDRRISAVLSGPGPSRTQSQPRVVMSVQDQEKQEMESALDAELVEKEVPQSYVYYSTMMLLSRLGQLDSLEAKHILTNGKVGARKHLRGVVEAALANELAEEKQDRRVDSSSSLSGSVTGHKPLVLPPLDMENNVRKFSAVGFTLTPRNECAVPQAQATPSARRIELLNRTSLIKDAAQLEDLLSDKSEHDAIIGDGQDEHDGDSDS